jgi:hypothetical protein
MSGMAFAASRAKLGVAVFLVHPGWNNKNEKQ